MITIFEIVTLPSVLNQTSADFSLLVVIDSDMPPSCLDRLTALTLGRTNVRLVRLDVKEILNPQIGGFAYVWEACQSAILENSLIES
ncbi:MAG: glycosyltransferase, partial [Alphaproteobacteria bacterium]|nr:glycosyltransferase [Alphaproteobacteria bacterium]